MPAALSLGLYLRRNWRRVLPVAAVIVLAVFAVSTTASLTGSMIFSWQRGWLLPYQRYSLVQALVGPLPDAWLRPLAEGGAAERVLPLASASFRYVGLFGSEPRPVLGLRRTDVPAFLRRTELSLVAGRLPREGEAGIALHRDLLRSRRLRLGDTVGRAAGEDFLPGRFRVVGVLAGPYPLALADYAALRAAAGMADSRRQAAALVLPRPGRDKDVETYLAGLPRSLAQVYTYRGQSRLFQREMANINSLIWILNLITVSTMALAVALLNLVFFRQRMGEFGLLAALGFRRSSLLRRAAAEVLAVTALSWGAGLLLARAILGLLGTLYYAPRGILLVGVDVRALTLTVPIPVLITSFTLAVVFWQLVRLDPVSILERR